MGSYLNGIPRRRLRRARRLLLPPAPFDAGTLVTTLLAAAVLFLIVFRVLAPRLFPGRRP
jgi:hypothetical protein